MKTVVEGDVAAVKDLPKQLTYAVAVSLTRTAKEGQAASIRAIQGTFTTRNRWYLPSNRFGVRIKPATTDDLQSEVRTAAHWLRLHETGGTKRPRGRYIAIPTRNARRSESQTIPRSRRPRALRNSFVAETRSGPVLFERRSRGGIQALYNLETSARISKQSVVVEPVTKVFTRRFGAIFARSLDEALETAR